MTYRGKKSRNWIQGDTTPYVVLLTNTEGANDKKQIKTAAFYSENRMGIFDWWNGG